MNEKARQAAVESLFDDIVESVEVIRTLVKAKRKSGAIFGLLKIQDCLHDIEILFPEGDRLAARGAMEREA